MNWGIFVGVGFIGSVLSFLVVLIIACFVLWVIFATPVGLIIIIGLIVYGLYRLFR